MINGIDKSEDDLGSFLIYYAMKFVGTPYLWGGNNPLEGFDCSGLAQEVLKSVGIDPPGDQTAQGLYNELSKKEWRSKLSPGAILFFGKSRFEIKHVSIAVNGEQMLEAGGGDRTVTNLDTAIKKGAYVRVRPIKNRKDLVAVLAPRI